MGIELPDPFLQQGGHGELWPEHTQGVQCAKNAHADAEGPARNHGQQHNAYKQARNDGQKKARQLTPGQPLLPIVVQANNVGSQQHRCAQTKSYFGGKDQRQGGQQHQPRSHADAGFNKTGKKARSGKKKIGLREHSNILCEIHIVKTQQTSIEASKR